MTAPEGSVETCVVNTDDNTTDYDLSRVVSNQFYSDDALSLWPIYATSEFIKEKHIDLKTFGRQNVIVLLKERNLLYIVTTAMPFCKRPILEFYCNLTEEVGQFYSVKYGRIFVRNHIYNLSPSVINSYYHTTDVAITEGADANIYEATVIITGGTITKYPSMPQRLAAASLTSLHSVLHKTAIWNWTPSTNSTNVTRPYVYVLYAIGEGKPFDFGQHVFSTVMAFGDGGLKSTRLPFPSLIYCILESQGFISHIDEALTGEADVLKLSPALLKGNRKLDLLCTATSVVPSVGNTTNNTATLSEQEPTIPTSFEDNPTLLAVPATFLQSQLAYTLNQIEYFQEQASLIRRMLQEASHFGHQGGVSGGE